jgi:hypothetical protein
MLTKYLCVNCDHRLLFFNSFFLCLDCGVMYLRNKFADTYQCWKWCHDCKRSVVVLRSYENLHFMCCPHCKSTFYHKELRII